MTNQSATPPREDRAASSLMEASRAAFGCEDFRSAARAIFSSCKSLLGATAGYVALLSDDGSENEVLFLDAGGAPCTVDPSLPMPIRGLREEAYRTRRAVYENDFVNSEWWESMPPGHADLTNVLFSPIVVEDKAVGLIGMANKPTPFDESDAEYAASFGDVAASALRNAMTLERLRETEAELTLLLQDAKMVALTERTKARTYLEAAGSMMFVLTAKGSILYANRSACDAIGRKIDEIRQLDWFEVAFSDDARDLARQQLECFLSGRSVGDYELPVTTPQGHRIISWRTAKTTADDGTVTAVICTGQDVTEKMEFISTLAHNEAMLQEAQSIAGLGWFSYHIETRTWASSSLLDAVLGIDESYPRDIEAWHDLLYRDGEDPLPRNHGDDLAFFANGADVEFRIVRPSDGSVRWIHMLTHITDAADGQRLVCTIQDVTSRKDAEEELLRHQHQLSMLAADIVEASERERREIASELHDVVGQELAVAKMTLQQLIHDTPSETYCGELGRVLDLVNHSLNGVRSVSTTLSPAPLYELGLAPALESLCDQYEERFGLRCSLTVDEALSALKNETANLAFRTIRELLNNVQRHSGADAAQISIRLEGATMEVAVEDAGRGFEPQLSSDVCRERFGLFSIDEQVALRGGALSIVSQPGSGTTVKVRLPFGE